MWVEAERRHSLLYSRELCTTVLIEQEKTKAQAPHQASQGRNKHRVKLNSSGTLRSGGKRLFQFLDALPSLSYSIFMTQAWLFGNLLGRNISRTQCQGEKAPLSKNLSTFPVSFAFSSHPGFSMTLKSHAKWLVLEAKFAGSGCGAKSVGLENCGRKCLAGITLSVQADFLVGPWEGRLDLLCTTGVGRKG